MAVPVQIDGRWGYINTDGDVIVAPMYDSATSFYEGIAFVTRDHTAIAINAQGEHLYSLPRYAQIDIQEYSYHPELLSIRLDQDYETIIYKKKLGRKNILVYSSLRR